MKNAKLYHQHIVPTLDIRKLMVSHWHTQGITKAHVKRDSKGQKL